MNGAVYISFFQGQLESVLEQVVQLAVQEISKTVGSSLNALLLETAVKEQENRRLRLQLQSRENRGRANASASDGGGSPAAGKNKAGKQRLHAPGGHSTEHTLPTDTRRLEQRGRVVDQLKSVMEQVLDFAVRELTKIVEASFDDLLLEITKMEREQQVLEERLGKSSDRGGGEKGRGGGGAGGRRRGSENDSASPSGSDDAREELSEVTVSKKTAETEGEPERPPVLSVSQDWVPILDKVFGPKVCSASGRSKSLLGEEEGGGGGRGSSGRRSSASMLHRLLTLPSQLLEDDDEDAAAKETLPLGRTCPSPLTTRGEEEEEEEEEEGDKGRKLWSLVSLQKKRRRVWSECEECGRRFSRMSLLKAHRQTHVAENTAADTASPSSPPGAAPSALRCSECGKRFSSAIRLHSHVRTEHAGNRS
uniref:C2H2-type domain-containing protein n=1 Tax=Seriola dumerili TaxID=41447 RepID=A0A3B4UTN3_SERDU